MIEPYAVSNRMVKPRDLTHRQREVAALVSSYVAVAHEVPSSGWLSRRLRISRQRATQHLEALKAKGWFDRRSTH